MTRMSAKECLATCGHTTEESAGRYSVCSNCWAEEHGVSPARKRELQEMINKMQTASERFYRMAQDTGCHPFIEFTGLLTEYIQICRYSLLAGVDFAEANTHTGIPLKMDAHHAKYLAEKFDCVLGPTLRADPEVHRIFLKQIGLKA